jgi:hypothetical protein
MINMSPKICTPSSNVPKTEFGVDTFMKGSDRLDVSSRFDRPRCVMMNGRLRSSREHSRFLTEGAMVYNRHQFAGNVSAPNTKNNKNRFLNTEVTHNPHTNEKKNNMVSTYYSLLLAAIGLPSALAGPRYATFYDSKSSRSIV